MGGVGVLGMTRARICLRVGVQGYVVCKFAVRLGLGMMFCMGFRVRAVFEFEG